VKDDPIWLGIELTLKLHDRQLAEHGGIKGVRDERLLESALARPRQQFAYSDPTPTLPELAAYYALGIARNHPFLDGNKRTAYVACRVFLVHNGWDLYSPAEERYEKFLRMASGELPEGEFVAWVVRVAKRVE
jgi:death on curing protein